MSRKRTGLRNRNRGGRSTYALQHKSTGSDRYGQWDSGRQRTQDSIAGHLVWTDGRPVYPRGAAAA